MKQFKFSTVMAVYNSQRYLDEAIDSLINQDLDFTENIQLILVDDGSTDDSAAICQGYADRYPENIVFLTKEHSGVAAARNLGLRNATGEFVNFLDSDDYLSCNAFGEVLEFFDKFEDCDVVSLPIRYFEKEESDDWLNYKFENDGVIDLAASPNNPQMSISSTFIRSKAIKEEFGEDLICSEDILFIYGILLEKQSLGVLSFPTYYCRKRRNLSAISDTVRFKKEFYTDRLENFHLKLINYSMEKYGEVLKFIQYLLVYDLKTVLMQKELFMCETDEEKESFFNALKEVLKNIDDEVIFDNPNLRESLKYFIFGLMHDDVHFEFEYNHLLLKSFDESYFDVVNPTVCLSEVDLKEGFFSLSGHFIDYVDEDYFTVDAINAENLEIFSGEYNVSPFNDRIVHLSKTQKAKYFTLKIPLEHKEFRINVKLIYHKNGDKTDYGVDNIISFTPKIRFNHDFDSFESDLARLDFVDDSFLIKPTYDFKFAVVMAVYNTQDYLSKAIDSLINQTMNFRDNVQLILVNDGSSDKSEEIALEYQKQYPDNIVLINQENCGQACARNNGLNHVRAKYVNFLDSDDYIDLNTLEKVWDFFELHQDETDIVAIPIQFFGKKEEPHMLNDKFEMSRVVDLEKEPNNPQLSSSSAFFRREVFDKYRFPTDVLFSEDVILINKILLDNKFLGLMNESNYYYRKRFDESSTIDTVRVKKEFFTDKIRDYFLYLLEYAKSREGYVPNFLQYTLAYDLQWVFLEDLTILNKAEIEEFYYYLNEVISYIDEDAIFYNQYIEKTHVREFFFYLKKGDIHTEIRGNNVLVKMGNHKMGNLATHNLWMDIVDLRDGVLNICGFLSCLVDRRFISIEAEKVKESSRESFMARYVYYTNRTDHVFLSDSFQFIINFELTIPIEANESSHIKLRLNYHKDGNNENFDEENVVSTYMNIVFNNHAKLSSLSNYKVNGSNILYFEDSTFHMIPYSLKTLLKKERENIELLKSKLDGLTPEEHERYKEVIKLRTIYLLTYPLFKLLYRKKPIYLFQDRIDIADDNAFHLFRYARKVRDNVKKFFVLSKDSKQYKTVSKFGKVLDHGSFKHKFWMLHADKIISTHPYETVINPFWSYEDSQQQLVSSLLDYKIYFLQHGVTKDNISSWMYKYDKNLSLIVTVSEEESKSFMDEGYCFDESIIQNLGFPRFDNLEKNDNKQILIIPTWRKNLRGNRNVFKDSDYFKSISSLLNNHDLIDMTKKGYKIIFRPHPELVNFIEESDERYIDLFDIPDEIYVSYDESYQDLLNNSSVLVTDYSSVFFDFAYLKKPVIYYHPLKDYHYDKSYFIYETMGFGDIVDCEDDLLDKLNEYIDNDCQMEEEYKKRVDSFFTYTDRNNCKRVYDWIYKD